MNSKRLLIILLYFFLTEVLSFGCSTSYDLTQPAQKIIERFPNIDKAITVELLKGSLYETPAFIFDSGEPGEVVLIIGGTHGNEPAGYEAALRQLELLEKSPPQKGKVIIIPLANRQSVINYDRRIQVPEGEDIERGNLNRCYPGDENGLPMEKMAFEIEELSKEHKVTIFIDQHEAKYFHLNTPKESNRDQGLGQTIIYYPNETSSWIVMNMIDEINSSISDSDEQFSSVEMPIPHSAAWWAGKHLDIAAFTFETMREMELDKRINFHLSLVRSVLELNNMW
ncbi:MAG: succinylglutamate desuccinylase/aspartoacylase family protein [Bacteroidota bacterium]